MRLPGVWKFIGLLGSLGCLSVAWIVMADGPPPPVDPGALVSLPGYDPHDDIRFGDPYPKAIVRETEFNFGQMDVGQSGTHTFIIHNDGPGKLKLRAGKTSCYCTALIVDDVRVPPGGDGRVRLEWRTDKPSERFLHGGWLKTDDPNIREIRLTVVGAVRAKLGASPDGATFASVTRNQQATGKVTLFSQVWDKIDIVKVESSGPELTWRETPSPVAVLAELKARSAVDLTLNAGPDLRVGNYHGHVRVHARSANDPTGETIIREVTLQGQVVEDVTLHNPFLENGVLALGMRTQGRADDTRIHCFVRGDNTDLAISDIRVQPEFVRVRMSREELPHSKSAHYVIDISIPADAPLGDYLAPDRQGEFRINIGHSTLSELHVKLAFAIVPDVTVNRPAPSQSPIIPEPQP